MVIYIFSGSNALYNTIIKYEILELSINNKVIVLLEFETHELENIKNVKVIPIYRDNKNKYIKYFRFIKYSFKLNNIYLNSFRVYPPYFLITHSDENFESILAIYIAKSKYNSFVIRRTPSVVINPQLEYILEKSTLIKNIERFILIFIHNYILLFYFTSKIHKSRLLWFPSNHNKYNLKKQPSHFDLSLCYSESCKFWLSKIRENSCVISLPLNNFKKFDLDKSSLESVLIVPSNDYINLIKILNFDHITAIIYEIDKIDNLIEEFIKMNYSVSLKFRSRDELNYYKKYSKYNNESNIKIISLFEDVYNIISNYRIVLGFNTTILWKQSLYQSNQVLISYQFIDHDLYNIYETNEQINFIKINSDLSISIRDILSNSTKLVTKKSTKENPRLVDIINKFYKND